MPVSINSTAQTNNSKGDVRSDDGESLSIQTIASKMVTKSFYTEKNSVPGGTLMSVGQMWDTHPHLTLFTSLKI